MVVQGHFSLPRSNLEGPHPGITGGEGVQLTQISNTNDQVNFCTTLKTIATIMTYINIPQSLCMHV